MLVPIGFFGGGASAGSFDLISTTLISTNTASVTFDVSTLAAAGYKHLQIRVTARDTRSSDTNDILGIRFNGDTSTNYSAHVFEWYIYGGSTAFNNSSVTNNTSAALGRISATNSTANSFGAVVGDLLNIFDTNTYKTVRGIGGDSSQSNYADIGINSGSWRSTAAVTSLTLFGNNGSLVAGSRISLYGIKG